jgi:hypothetical protein
MQKSFGSPAKIVVKNPPDKRMEKCGRLLFCNAPVLPNKSILSIFIIGNPDEGFLDFAFI